MRFAVPTATALLAMTMLAGCGAVTVPDADSSSSVIKESVIETPQAAPEAVVEVPAPAATPTPPPAPVVYVTSVDLLGEGAATIVWNINGTQNQTDVTLPYSVVISSGETARLDDPYVAAGAVATAGGYTGCRITVNNVVVDEVLPQATQMSALCDTNG